jgi:hypothetical protein
MTAARAHAIQPAPSAHALAVGDLLTRLAVETARASASLEPHDTPPLLAVLDARDAMLDSLEGLTQAFTRARAPHELRTAAGIRAELVARAAALQQANVHLLARVRTECDRLARALADADRPDGLANAYGEHAHPGLSQLDLVR